MSNAQLALDTLRTTKAPFFYDEMSQKIFNEDGQMICDLRGWGWIQKLDNAENRQDAIGHWLAELINAQIKNKKN